MKILIIEDEHYAAKRLEKLIMSEIPSAVILGIIDTISEAKEWFSSHVEPHLVFMDIQLADGLSFQIFDTVKVKCPIIFTTAYDEYALDAFKVNSIDYLLKPLDQKDFSAAIEKYHRLYPSFNVDSFDWSKISKEFLMPKDDFKKRFLIKTGSAYAYLKVEDISLIYSEDSLSFAYTCNGKKVLLDYSLDRIIEYLDPDKYFRVSRKHIISLSMITKIHPYLNGRLKLEHNFDLTDELLVSRDRAKEFKLWLDK